MLRAFAQDIFVIAAAIGCAISSALTVLVRLPLHITHSRENETNIVTIAFTALI
jgi:hypothetical protein